MINSKILSKIESIVGKNNFSTSKEDKICYSYDATPLFEKYPDAVVFPEDAEQISKIITLANEQKFAVVPRGAGSGLSGGSIPTDDSIVLVMTRWNKILEFDESNLTITVQPGVITELIDIEAAKKGLFYPPDPGSMKFCTIGGNVAENAGGLRGLKYGVTKNYILGLEMVTPSGEIVFSGGKNVKDVAGYNLRDVMIGSEGTLGIFTKILLRLIPRPESSKTILAFFDSTIKSGQVVSEIIASKIIPSMVEFLDNTTIKCVEDYARLGLNTNLEALLLIEIDGSTDEVNRSSNIIQEICKKQNAEQILIAKTADEALKLKTARRSAFSALARVKPTTILEDATVPRSKLPEMLEAIQKIVNEENVLLGNFGHAGDGNLHPTCLTDERDKSEILKAEKAFEKIFNTAIKLGGTITGEHGTGLSKSQFLEAAVGSAGLQFMKKIKSSWDPNNILNPGKIFSVKPKCEGTLPRQKKDIKEFSEN
ncbi:MAG: FAD-binding protein [Ignavibacteria bacterium]|nr:FAD-binding protein [Ignavibacteria bacterium]